MNPVVDPSIVPPDEPQDRLTGRGMPRDPDHEVRLVLPWDRPPAALWSNARPNRWARARDTRIVRSTVLALAQAAGLHRLPQPVRHVAVRLTWAPGDRRRRDEDNLAGTQKAAADALARGPRRDWIGLELVADDTRVHMTKHAPELLPPPARGMWLDVALWFQATEQTGDQP